jgi:hypothetical protein
MNRWRYKRVHQYGGREMNLQGEHHEKAYDDADDFGSGADGANFQRSGDLDESGADHKSEKAPQGEDGDTECEFGQHFDRYYEQTGREVNGLGIEGLTARRVAITPGWHKTGPADFYWGAESKSR